MGIGKAEKGQGMTINGNLHLEKIGPTKREGNGVRAGGNMVCLESAIKEGGIRRRGARAS